MSFLFTCPATAHSLGGALIFKFMPTGIYLHKPHQLFQEGHKGYWKGKKLLRKTKKKMSEAKKGKMSKNILQIAGWNKDKKMLQISGNKHWNWKGGKYKSKDRWYIYFPNHPSADKRGYIRHSRLIVEKCLGRYLTKKEVIHHINEKPNDDRPENLYLFISQKEHWIFHHSKNKPILKSNLI